MTHYDQCNVEVTCESCRPSLWDAHVQFPSLCSLVSSNGDAPEMEPQPSGSLLDCRAAPFLTPRPTTLCGHVVWIKNNLKCDPTEIAGFICSCSITYPILTNNKKVCTFLQLYYILPQIAFQKMIPNYTPTSNVWQWPAPSLALVLPWGWGASFHPHSFY